MNRKFRLSNSLFFRNYGEFGIAIKSVNMGINIDNCYFFNNSAAQDGGAINFKGNTSNLKIKNSKIFYNKAKIAGGILLETDQ